MQYTNVAAFLGVLAILFSPVLIGYFAQSANNTAQSRTVFALNAGRNGFVATLAGAIAGNIGIGSFLALFLFAQGSPVIGFSIVGAYTLGLALCALLAPVIRARSAHLGTVGLIDMIAKTHRIKRPALIWMPVAFVFVLRSAVQLGALGFITASVFDVSSALAIAVCAALIGAYLVTGGYRAAVQTDILQATVIVSGCALAWFGLGKLEASPPEFFSLGDYRPAILAGIWLFIPWSAVLAVDNWQRITLADTTEIAQSAYLIAAFLSGFMFFLMALAGFRSPDGMTMYQAFDVLLPDGFQWIAAAMFVACIMSSIDTFIMPLVSAAASNRSVTEMRLMVVALVTLTALTSIAFSDTLDAVITAFNSLTVFLPAAFGALFISQPAPKAAIWSMNAGLVSATGFSLIDQNAASLVGFTVAAAVYGVLSRRSATLA